MRAKPRNYVGAYDPVMGREITKLAKKYGSSARGIEILERALATTLGRKRAQVLVDNKPLEQHDRYQWIFDNEQVELDRKFSERENASEAFKGVRLSIL